MRMDQNQERIFLETVRENRDRMFRIAMSLLHAPADAEDAVSAAVESTWKHYHGIRDPKTLAAYMIRSAVNAAKDELRRRKRTVPMEEIEREPAPANREDPLFEYICGLEEKYRLPLVMKMQERMTEQEIASALRLPRGTVSSRIQRALKILKEQMTKEETVHVE